MFRNWLEKVGDANNNNLNFTFEIFLMEAEMLLFGVWWKSKSIL